MHCNSTYPMKDEEANLKCIETLKKDMVVTLVTQVMKQVCLKFLLLQ